LFEFCVLIASLPSDEIWRNTCRNTKVFQMTLLATGQIANPMGGVVSREKYCTAANILGMQFFLNKQANQEIPGIGLAARCNDFLMESGLCLSVVARPDRRVCFREK
jgi:hypothetical protein